MTAHHGFEELKARVRKLERQLRVALVGFLLAAVALGIVFGAPQATSQPTTVVARAVHVVDSTGLARISLQLDSDGSPRIDLGDTEKRPRLALRVLGDGTPVISFGDANRKSRLLLDLGADGAPRLRLGDGTRPRLGLFVFDSGPAIGLNDAAGRRRAMFALLGNGQPILQLLNENDQPLFEAPNR